MDMVDGTCTCNPATTSHYRLAEQIQETEAEQKKKEDALIR